MQDGQTTYRELITAADNCDAALAIAQLARRRLALFTHDLEPQLYGTAEFVAAVKDLALSGRMTEVRILLADSTRATKEGHRLLELARRLSSRIEIRKPHRDYLDLAETFLIADEQGLLYRKLATRWEGFADTHEPLQAREQSKLFDEIWQRSQQDPETRRLGI